jgi:hypothetical protein
VTKDLKQPSRLGIRVEDKRTWILTDQFDGSDMGGVTYQHDSHGNQYQPWLLVDGARTDTGIEYGFGHGHVRSLLRHSRWY